MENENADSSLSFDVEVQDINDNAPLFTYSHVRANVKENTPEGEYAWFLPVELNFIDKDKQNTPNSSVTVSIISQTPAEPKIGVEQLSNQMAQLKLKGCFDYDKIKTYEVIVQAKDHGTPPLSSTVVVTLNIVDTNSHPPKFKENQYYVEVSESVTKRDVLRVAVEDKDTLETPAWRAKYFIIDKDEEEYFQIETDPNTNEGILNVIKGKDFEKTTVTTLEIGVENEEPLFACADKSTGKVTLPPLHKVNITIKVIDVNDPPQFEKDTVHLYLKEEEEPGKLLFTAKVDDDDSDIDKIRFSLSEDPAHWMTINEATGQITSAKKMDRESPFVDEKGIYKVAILAVDDGMPPATGTCRVLIHLGDINDNTPKLVHKSVILCGNKGNKVMVPAKDSDNPPYSGPFAFSLGGDVDNLKQQWKLDPASGMEGGLVSLTSLPYGNYSVPLEIQDQQATNARETVEVIVCDCGKADVCRAREPISSSLGAAGIGLIFLGLLIFLLLLLLFICNSGKRAFNHIPIAGDEGNQTLIKYNQEGGGAACTARPTRLLPSSNGVTVTDSLSTTRQIHNVDPVIIKNDTSGFTVSHSNMGLCEMRQRDDFTKLGGQNKHLSRKPSRRIIDWEGSTRRTGSFRMRSNQHLAVCIERRIHVIDGDLIDHPMYQPFCFAYEGDDSICASLDELSLSNLGDDVEFLNDLGPKFETLGNICHQTVQNKNSQI
nr:PREDICTED: cadherin-like protein 26 [Paralichthys olivaceus]